MAFVKNMQDNNFLEDDFDNMTDTDSDSSTDSKEPPFESSPYILNVHEINKDENRVPSANQPDPQAPTGQVTGQIVKQKIKKIKKKKKKTPSQATISSESASEISVPTVAALVEEPGKEEFYDAHGSFHTITQHPVAIPDAPVNLTIPAALPAPATAQGPVIAAGLVQARSEHGPDPKQTAPTAQEQRTSKTPSAVTKPVDPPD